MDGKLPLTVVRAGKQVQVELPVSPKCPLVTPNLGDAYPSYFIYGPLVFSTATDQFIRALTGNSRGARYMSWLIARNSPLITRFDDKPAFPGEELVVVPSPFFPHKLAEGYSSPFCEVVKAVNGIPIKNLNQLVEVLRDAKGESITVAFDDRDGETLVFPRAAMLAATDDILTDNGVRSQGSADTLAIWNAKVFQIRRRPANVRFVSFDLSIQTGQADLPAMAEGNRMKTEETGNSVWVSTKRFLEHRYLPVFLAHRGDPGDVARLEDRPGGGRSGSAGGRTQAGPVAGTDARNGHACRIPAARAPSSATFSRHRPGFPKHGAGEELRHAAVVGAGRFDTWSLAAVDRVHALARLPALSRFARADAR